jgi:hypothetical protein
MSTTLNSSGIVFPDSTTQTTANYIRINSNIPVFSMSYSGSTYGISNATQTKMTLNTVGFDSHSGANTSTYQYTVPVTGYYRINYSVGLQGYYGSTSTPGGIVYFDMNIRVNGVDQEDGGLFDSTYSSYGQGLISLSASSLYYLVSGQTVSVYAQGNKGTPYSSGILVNSTYLSGHLVN